MTDYIPFLEKLRQAVSTEIGKQIGLSANPTGDQLGGKSLETPYAVFTPVIGAFIGSSMVDAHDSVDEVFQCVSVGVNAKQSMWISDQIFRVLTNKTVGGSYQKQLDLAPYNVEWRLCDMRGTTLPSGPSLFNTQDTYRIRRGA